MASETSQSLISVDNACRLLSTTPVELQRAQRWGFVPRPGPSGYPVTTLVNGFARYLQSGELTVTDAGEMLGVSKTWVLKLIADGYVEKNERGNITREGAFRGYLKWLKDEDRRSSKTAEEARWRDAKTRKVEMEMAVLDGRLIETAEALSIVDDLVGIFRAELSGMPARVTTDLAVRARVEKAGSEVLSRVENRFAERASAVGPGAPTGAPGTSDAPRRVGRPKSRLSGASRKARST